VSQSRATAGKGDSGTGATVLPCLFNEMNSCRTSFGYRLLKEWLSTPLTDVAAIQERQAAVKWLVAAQHEGGLSKKAPTTPRAAWLGNANKILGGGGGNIEQLLAALQQGKLSPARLVVLLQWAVNVKGLLCTAETAQDMAPPLVLASIIRSKHLEEASDTAQTLLTRLSSFTHAQTAGTLSSMGDDGILVSLECGLQERFPDLAQKIAVLKGCEEDMVIHLERVRKLLRKPALQYRTLNTGGGSCLEHLIEVDAKDVAANPALVPAEWVQTNSTKTVLRYHPPEVIKSQESLILARDEVSIAAKQAWRVFLLEEAKPQLIAPLRAAIQSLSVIDCLLSLAKLACRPGYVCPEFSTETEEERVTINLKGARHPVAERLLEKAGSNTPFQPNDVVLRCQGADRSCLVVTGPNMGGKSTYVKMASTLCLMGQVGSFVPAEQAKLPILDNILTRMGAGDDLASGRSTFATELYRTSSILRRATARSLVVLDELGRGTSTHDGVCIAVSTLRHLVCNIGCALFFVTHYSQASDLVSMVNGSPVKDLSEQDRPLRGKVENIHMSYLQSDAIDETNDVSSVTPAGSVVFLYRAVDGAAEGSFGLNVARLAGLSEEFLELAHKRSQWMRYHIQQCGLHGMPRSSSSSFSPESSLRKRKADGSNATLGVTKKTAIEVEEKEDNEHNKKVYQQEPSEGGEDQEEEALRRIIEESQRRLNNFLQRKCATSLTASI
jgi:DNA mismatch repair protein MSH3